MVAESLLIGTAAGGTGAVLGSAGVIILSLAGGWVPVVDLLSLVLAPAAAVVLSAAAGFVPAMRSSRIDAATALRG